MEDTRDPWQPGEGFYDADEGPLSGRPTLRARWSPQGQQVMMPTPGQPSQHEGWGAIDDDTGETGVRFRGRTRRREGADRWQILVDNHPTRTLSIAWDQAGTHADEALAAVVRAAAGRGVRLSLPTSRPWLTPIER